MDIFAKAIFTYRFMKVQLFRADSAPTYPKRQSLNIHASMAKPWLVVPSQSTSPSSAITPAP